MTGMPRLGLAVAVTAGSYGSVENWRPPTAVLRDGLLPAFEGG
jgi:hypothetical protein